MPAYMEPRVETQDNNVDVEKSPRLPLNERILKSISHKSLVAHPGHDVEIGPEALIIFNCIVDSVIAFFRVDFTGRGELVDRQQKLAQMLSRLIKIAEEFNVAVYLTNQASIRSKHHSLAIAIGAGLGFICLLFAAIGAFLWRRPGSLPVW